jgi:hypothetical protein
MTIKKYKTLNGNDITIDINNRQITIPHLNVRGQIGIQNLRKNEPYHDVYVFLAGENCISINRKQLIIRLSLTDGKDLCDCFLPKKPSKRELTKTEIQQLAIDFVCNEGFLENGTECETLSSYIAARTNKNIKQSFEPRHKGDEFCE